MTAGQRPSTNTRTAIGWRPRLVRLVGHARTPRPSCGDGGVAAAVGAAAVGVGGVPPRTVGGDGERQQQQRPLLTTPSSD